MIERLDELEDNPPEGLEPHELKTLFERKVYMYFQLGWAYANVESMLDNGYFAPEPLVVLAQGGDEHIVIEGNRRLAALLSIR